MGRGDTGGALVAQVRDSSPAAEAGLKPGDVVTGFNGRTVKSPRDLARAVADIRAGDKAKVEIWRDGRTETLGVTIARMPEDKTASADSEARDPATPQVGLALAPLTPEVRSTLGVGRKVNGAVVARVQPNSPAAESGLEPGDIIVKVAGKPTDSPAAAIRAIREGTRKDKVVALQVLRNGRNLFVALDTAQS